MLLLLSLCISVDYATENDTITNINQSEIKVENCTLKPNMTYIDTTILNKTHNTVKGFDKIHNVYPTITMTGKPSCSCGRYSSYTWRTRSYVNYCPYCHRYGTLYNAHKWQSRFENEITCRKCSADFCINCGKEKYSWSRKYLRRA